MIGTAREECRAAQTAQLHELRTKVRLLKAGIKWQHEKAEIEEKQTKPHLDDQVGEKGALTTTWIRCCRNGNDVNVAAKGRSGSCMAEAEVESNAARRERWHPKFSH